MTETPVSLLERLQDKPGPDDWRRLVELYQPLIRAWLGRHPALAPELDDLTQDVLGILVRKVPEFRRERPGSFRRWLRVVTANRVKEFWRARGARPPAAAGEVEALLADLEDPHSDLSRLWDQEHDRHVAHRLLEMIGAEFEPGTWEAFRRHVLEDRPAAEVAAALGTTDNAVLIAKSRILRRLRQEARGLLD